MTRYFTGRPCPRGHVAERYTSKSTCVTCLETAVAAQPAAVRRQYAKRSYDRTIVDPARREKLRKRTAAYQRERRHYDSSYRERLRQYSVRSRYGFDSVEELLAFEARYPQCGICGATENLAIDHDHTCCPGDMTCGKCQRGRLCRSCNAALGLFKDSTDILARAVSYLESFAGAKDKR